MKGSGGRLSETAGVRSSWTGRKFIVRLLVTPVLPRQQNHTSVALVGSRVFALHSALLAQQPRQLRPGRDGHRPQRARISERLTRIFLRDKHGRRPVYGGMEKFQADPHWGDYLLFHEYFHGDNGAGLGASHQTGWTGVVATLIKLFGTLDARQLLEVGKQAAFVRGHSDQEVKK